MDTSQLPFVYISDLGHGSFGVVLKANNTTTSSQCAVKIIFPSDTPKDIKNLERECEIMKDKNHINVVKVLNVFKTNFTGEDQLEQIVKVVNDEKIHDQLDIYMTRIRRKKTLPAILIEMELCGSNLREWLNQHVNHDKKDLNFQLTQVKIIKDMISGMQFLHENKIIHRDFKPENVMFSEENSMFSFPIKIGDFGLCRIFHSEETRTSTLTSRMGTLDYMAPEMDGNSYNLQSDIYSLGLVIWEVSQLIPFKSRKKMFNDLVMFEKTELVVSFLPTLSSTIISMTKKGLDRMKSLNEFEDNTIAHLKVELNKLLIGSINIYVAKNGDELRSILRNCKPGDTINLPEGEFEGPFEVNCSGVKIIGQGNKTVLKFKGREAVLKYIQFKIKKCLTIHGDNCCVSNLHVNYSRRGIGLIGSNNSIENVGLVCFGIESIGLEIDGRNNKVSGLTVSQDKYANSNGIKLIGSDNILENIEINNMDVGIYISSSNNTLSNIICNDTRIGVQIRGLKNKLSTFKYKINTHFDQSEGYGVLVFGSENELEDIQCSGQLAFGIYFVSDSSNCKVSNSVCGPLEVRGRGHTFNNVDCGPRIGLWGKGHKLIKCRGKQLLTQKDQQLQMLLLKENNFDEIKASLSPFQHPF